VKALVVWCQENNLFHNVDKMKELIMDYRKQQREHAPIHTEGSFKFPSVHITEDLKLSLHTDNKFPKTTLW
jgi:hypothetical protein